MIKSPFYYGGFTPDCLQRAKNVERFLFFILLGRYVVENGALFPSNSERERREKYIPRPIAALALCLPHAGVIRMMICPQ